MEMNWARFWKDYRKHTGALCWRLATPADLPALRRLRNVSERFLGAKQRNPSLFDMPVLLALVAENEKGKIVDAIYLEAQVELIKIACTREGSLGGTELDEDISQWLKSIGFKTVLATSPTGLKGQRSDIMEKLGFRRVAENLCYWKRNL